MKRKNNLFQQIISLDNLRLADTEAQKGKAKQRGVIKHNKNREQNLVDLHETLKNKTYRTSSYDVFTIQEPKERTVYRLPYYPDRIVHHAIIRILEPIFVSVYTADTYSCIKGRGLHLAVKKLQKALKDKENTTYCLKLDIRKFYENVDHDILKALLRRKFKDADLLIILDEIVDSAKGLPIGNYMSQYLANFYLSYFDHWLKEDKRVKYYFRYCDDVVLLAAEKPYLHALLAEVRAYLRDHLKLTVKDNYQIFPVDSRGIDFLGYRFFHTHTLLRKSIKRNLAKAILYNDNKQSIASLMGWAKHCNSIHLLKTLNEQAA
ncbi:group II intron reverse transcriptase domain-containing protein [Candidatus Dependentiae bacterium]|nr:group II intron reverse transcriptase domain-containing protein [Candidatus Dependentiae bacterium]